MADDLTLDEIRTWLVSDHLEQIAEDAIPDGKISSGEWIGHLNGGKCSVCLRGAKRGVVGYWLGQGPEGANGGDVISLIWVAQGFSTYGQAVRFAKREYLGIDEREFSETQKRQFAKRRAEQEAASKRRVGRDERRAQQRQDDVRAIWEASKPIAGTIAERYLIGRGIPKQDWPRSLRFNLGLRHGENGDRWPALVCAVQSPKNKLIGLWRIFLNGNSAEKAPVENPKLGLGPCKGGAVRLGPTSDTICIAEGIETAFGVKALLADRWPIWAALSTSGMIGLELPDKVRSVKIYADGDRHKFRKDGKVSDPPGPVAAEKLASRLRAAGIEVSVHLPPERRDWLDCWNETRGGE